MDHTYQRPLQMPACYAVLSNEEMTYTEGGAFSIDVTPEQVANFTVNFCTNVAVNLLTVAGRYAFQSAVSMVQTGMSDGLSLEGIIGHQWGKLNTTSKILTIGLVGLGGYYAFLQARSLYYSVMNLVGAIRDTYDQYLASQQAQQDALQPALAVA